MDQVNVSAKPPESLSLPLANATVFISSGCMMVIELVAGRVIASNLGSSLYTWTSVIGVVLAGIAIGNYIGGRLADQWGSRRTLSILFVLSAIMAASIAIVDQWVGSWPALWTLPWPARVASHVTLVFFLPAGMLGTISPVVAKMALERSRQTGRTIGSVYAWGVVGSIVGTFMTGFYLVALLGTRTIIWSVAGTLVCMAIAYGTQAWQSWGGAVAIGFLCLICNAPYAWAKTAGERWGIRQPVDPNVIFKTESQYSLITIYKASEQRDIRGFMLDTLLHSQLDMKNLANFQYPYEKVYASVTKRLSKDKKQIHTLTIGGGGYVFPRYIDMTWPGSNTEVAEIDPAVTKAAKDHFGMPQNSPIRCHDEDGRVFVDRLIRQKHEGKTIEPFDFIYCDAVNDYNVPYQLTSVEFMDHVHRVLAKDGTYLVNMIDLYDPGDLLGALVNTMQRVFPYVGVLIEGPPLSERPKQRETFVIVGRNEPFDVSNLGQEYHPRCRVSKLSQEDLDALRKRSGGIVLSDDYSPVENLLAPVVRENARLRAIAEYVGRGNQRLALGQLDEALSLVEEGLTYYPGDQKLRNEHGYLLYKKNLIPDAIHELEQLVSDKPLMADAHDNLGKAYFKARRAAEAATQFGATVTLRPDDADAYFNLGNALAATGKLKDATVCFREVLRLHPNDADAIDHLRKVEAVMARQKPTTSTSSPTR